MFDLEKFDERSFKIAWLVSKGWVYSFYPATWRKQGVNKTVDSWMGPTFLTNDFTLEEAFNIDPPPVIESRQEEIKPDFPKRKGRYKVKSLSATIAQR